MGDEKEWWETKKSKERRKGVMGRWRVMGIWRGVMGDEKKWWEDEEEWWEIKRSNERQKGMIRSKQERKKDNGKWKDVIENNGDKKYGIMRSNRRWKMMRNKK
jgi:hypothetical protein